MIFVRIRNAVSTIFYIENCSADEIGKNREELMSLMRVVFKTHGVEIVNSILDRIGELHTLSLTSKPITSINDFNEVSSMLETRTKKWEESVFERGKAQGKEQGIELGKEQGIEQRDREIVTNMHKNGADFETIKKMTGLPLDKIKKILESAV